MEVLPIEVSPQSKGIGLLRVMAAIRDRRSVRGEGTQPAAWRPSSAFSTRLTEIQLSFILRCKTIFYREPGLLLREVESIFIGDWRPAPTGLQQIRPHNARRRNLPMALAKRKPKAAGREEPEVAAA